MPLPDGVPTKSAFTQAQLWYKANSDNMLALLPNYTSETDYVGDLVDFYAKKEQAFGLSVLSAMYYQINVAVYPLYPLSYLVLPYVP